MKSIYLDYAATTPVDNQVFKKMQPFFSESYGNPSEIHRWGIKAHTGVNNARKQVATALGCEVNEIIFTGCATESINLAHKGLVEAIKTQGKIKEPHIITTKIEHKAVLETVTHLERLGWAKISYLPVDKYGLVSLEDIKNTITPDTVLVSIMYVNNEVGTIQPIVEIGKLLKQQNEQRSSVHLPKIFFHTDATQALPYFDCNVNKLGVDLLSFSGHKIYAPKGTGALFIKTGTPIVRQQDGGSQENGLRAGTEAVPSIVGLGEAVRLAIKIRAEETKRLKTFQKYLISEFLKIPGIQLTGHPTKRSPHICSFLVEGVEGEAMMLLLSDLGIAVSTGSACNSNVLSSSHVLTAMNIPAEDSHGSLRLSLGKDSKQTELDYVIGCVKKVAKKLRKMAPNFTDSEIGISTTGVH